MPRDLPVRMPTTTSGIEPASSRPRWDPLVVAAAALVILGVVLRVSSLGADPTYPYWAGWLQDEGRWVEAAREWALFGTPDLDSRVSRVHLILAPAFQALTGLSFHLFGVGSVQARLPSVAAGLGLLVVAGLFLKDRLRPRPAAGLVALLAVHPDLIYFSRVAIPEGPSLFFQFAAFAAVVGGKGTTGRAFGGGLLLALALGLKGTTILVAPCFVALVPCVARAGDSAGAGRRTAAFLAGLLAPALAFGVAVVALGAGPGAAGFGGLLRPFLQLDTLFGAVNTLFQGPWTMRVNLVLVASAATGLLVWSRSLRASWERSLFVGAVVWAVGWLTAWALLDYFPERYLVHLHVPLLLALVSGLVLLQDGDRSAEGGSVEPGWKPAFASALPAAVVMTPAVLSVADLSGLPPSGLLERLLWMGTLVLAGAAVIRGRGGTAAAGAPVFAAIVGVAWLVGRELGAPIRDFWSVGGVRPTLVWIGLLGLSATTTSLLGARRLARIGPAQVGAGWAAALAVFWALEGARGLATRTYVVREVAAWLETEYAPGTLLGAYGTASIFLETPFPYRERIGTRSLPDVVVVWRGEGDPLLAGYRPVAEFPLELGRDFFDPRPGGEWVRVLVRGGTPPGIP